MRTEYSIRNIKYVFLSQVAAIIISLVSRMFFVRLLSATYLGLNGLFTNILTILSFVELGIGPAFTFALYEPLKDKDTEKIKTLMHLFKKAYTIIGIIILILGTLLIPFVPYLISDLPDIPYFNLIYWLFVLNTSVSYFGSYKKTLLTSDQKNYLVIKIHYIFYCIMNIVQIISLFLTKSFLIYLIIQVLFTIAENIYATIYVNKRYPYLNDKEIAKLDANTSRMIKKNVSAMVVHKFGSILVTATDNLILSKYVGLVAVGIYSNYYLIINNVKKILKQIFNSTIASVGNLGAEGNKGKLLKTFQHINFINFYIQSLFAIGMLVTMQDFITLWVGESFLFSFPTLVVLIACFYFTGLRSSVLLFKEALGIYWQDRYKAFVEALLNLIISIVLVKYIGVIGVFIGTLLSTLLTCFWVEPVVLYKYGFKQSVKTYFADVMKNTIVMIFLAIICLYILDFIQGPLLIVICVKVIVTFVIVNIVYYLLYRKNDNYLYFKSLVLKTIKRMGRKHEKAD